MNIIQLGRSFVKTNPLISNKGHGSPFIGKKSEGNTNKELNDYHMAKGGTSYNLKGLHLIGGLHTSKSIRNDINKAIMATFIKPPNHVFGEPSPRASTKSLCIFEDYSKTKANIDINDFLKRAFIDEEKKQDNTNLKDVHITKAINYKLEAFTSSVKSKYSKDLSLYLKKKTLCLGIQNVIAKISTFFRDDLDEVIEVKNPNTSMSSELSIDYRPYLYDFLDDVSKKFELIIYSTFNSQYVNAIADAIEKKDRKSVV